MKARIYVQLKPGVLDPEASTVARTLGTMGFDALTKLDMGKFFDIELNTSSEDEAMSIAKDMCEKLLSNTVIENYKIEIAS